MHIIVYIYIYKHRILYIYIWHGMGPAHTNQEPTVGINGKAVEQYEGH